jgi:hypothetical protein
VENSQDALQEFVPCNLYVCPGTTLTFATCHSDGKTCNGDTFLRLFDEEGIQIDFNDDRCGYCSGITHTFTQHCQTYTLHQGCYGAKESCKGMTTITHSHESVNVHGEMMLQAVGTSHWSAPENKKYGKVERLLRGGR